MRRKSKVFLFLLSLLISLFLLPSQVIATAKTDIGVTFTENTTLPIENDPDDSVSYPETSKPEGNGGRTSDNLPSMGEQPLIYSANILGLTFLLVLLLLIRASGEEVRRDE